MRHQTLPRYMYSIASKNSITNYINVYRKDDELLETGESLERLVVAHPVMSHPTSAQLIYTSYSGWLSSGTSTWTVDKILVTDAFGKRYEYFLWNIYIFFFDCVHCMILTTFKLLWELSTVHHASHLEDILPQ